MITKNILNKIYLHPIFLISVLIFIYLGRFRFICYFMLLVLVHEIGHIITSLLFKWEIDKIIILPFGGLTKYNIKINTPLIEEFLVSISGIVLQLFFFILVRNNINYKYFSLINYFIILFNLMPIYPLDGSKILNVFLNIITNYRNSILLTIIISYIFILISLLFFFNINKMVVLIFSFLILEVNRLYKEKESLFNKFILERYLGEYRFKKEKKIDNIYKMRRDYRHIFYIDNRYITEKYYLSKYFS